MIRDRECKEMMNEDDLFDPRCLGGEDVELGELETRASLPATNSHRLRAHAHKLEGRRQSRP